jgi:hypothetical protein
LNLPYIEKEDIFVFSFPRTPIQPLIYFNDNNKNEDENGYRFIDMLNQSNLIGEPYLKEDFDKLTDLLKEISSNNRIKDVNSL